MKRKLGFLAVALITVIGCSGMKDMGKTADLKGCKKFAKKRNDASASLAKDHQ